LETTKPVKITVIFILARRLKIEV